MSSKTLLVSNYILDRLESGVYRQDERIPAARVLAEEVGAAFAIVQHAVSTLVQAGILYAVDRQGSGVRKNWRTGLLPGNLVFFNPDLPWIPGFRMLLEEHLPDFRLCSKFTKGMFEVRTTLHVQQFRNDYLDLAPYLRQVYPDSSVFFESPFRGFREADGSIRALPFIFSPRVMFCNPELLKGAGIHIPSPDWTFEEFLEIIDRLKKFYPPENLLNYNPRPFFWMNFVFRSGGCLINPEAKNPIQIDSPQTIRAIRLIRELRKRVDCPEQKEWARAFSRGEMVFALSEREFLSHLKGFSAWRTLPLPRIPGGADRVAQATDLICVRKECVDHNQIAEFLKFMLSETVQDYLASARYGIPIRRSSAQKSIDLSDPNDALFISEISSMCAEYNLDSPELTCLIQNGINRIINDLSLPLEESLSELARAVRLFLDIQKTVQQSA